MPRTRASRTAAMLPANPGVFAHRASVLETGDRLEHMETRERLRVSDNQPVHMDVEETRMPWAWLRLEGGPGRGEEHRVEGDLMGLVRPGHELVVVFEDGTDRPLLVEDLTTGQSFEDDPPHPFRRGSGPLAWIGMILGAAFFGVVILTVPIALPWLWLSTSVVELFVGRVDRDIFGWLMNRTPVVAGLVAVIAAHLYDARETRRRAIRRRDIRRAAVAARSKGTDNPPRTASGPPAPADPALPAAAPLSGDPA